MCKDVAVVRRRLFGDERRGAFAGTTIANTALVGPGAASRAKTARAKASGSVTRFS